MIKLYKKEIEAILLFEADRQSFVEKATVSFYNVNTGISVKNNVRFGRTLWAESCQRGAAQWFNNLMATYPKAIELLTVIEFYRQYINKPTELIIDGQKFVI